MKKRRFNIKCMVIPLLGMALLTACGSSKESTQQDMTEVVEETQEQTGLGEDNRYTQTGNMPITDNDALYEQTKDDQVVTMYLTVQSGNASEGTNHTWTEINQYSVYDYESMGVDRYKVEGTLKVGNESGPVLGEFGYEAATPNVTVSIRGQSSSSNAQKNYKIRIRDGKGSYQNQKIINLNKHMSEGLRFRNKLCYDLMKDLPGMMSARTQFVHLYVKDMTKGGSGEYEDYGLYTQVEQINKTYLKMHGLDKNGQLYKVNFFEFQRYEDIIRLSSDAGYDADSFEEYLEIKGDNDHSKLIEMLDDVNDTSKPIEETFAKWFDEENVLSWLAFHILVGNKDTQSRNVFLYSPLNVDKWYFISWDNDGSFATLESTFTGSRSGLEWENGISNYWGNTLFRRIFKSQELRAKLDERILLYRNLLTEDKLTQLAQKYNKLIEPYLWRLPDVLYMRLTYEERQQVLEEFPKEIEINYQKYLESYEKPQPFYIGVPQENTDGLHLEWDISYDFQGEDITYTVQLSDTYTFTTVLYEESNLHSPMITMTVQLEPGKYYIRVKATNESGREQYAFDTYMAEEGKQYGIKCFYYLEDGSIVEDGANDE